MAAFNRQRVDEFVNHEIVRFHDSRLMALDNIQLHDILRKKNPYLFRAKNMLKADELITSMLDARLSSSEEKHFGDFYFTRGGEWP